MSFSYFMPPRDDKDRIRLLIGDRDGTDQLLQDEEIYEFLILEGNVDPQVNKSGRWVLYHSAAACASAVAGSYARLAANQALDMREDAQQKYEQYSALAATLLAKASRVGVGPRVGGLSLGDKAASVQDTDLVQPFFKRDMQTEPGTGPEAPQVGNLAAQTLGL